MTKNEPDAYKLRLRLAELQKNKVIADYLEFIGLSTPAQQKIRDEWDEYYLSAKESPSAMLYRAMRQAIKENNMTEVRKLRQENKIMRENGHNITIKMPAYPDPEVYKHDQLVSIYKSTLFEIKQAEKQTKTDF